MTEIKKKGSWDARSNVGRQEVILFVGGEKVNLTYLTKEALWPSPEDQIQFYQDTH